MAVDNSKRWASVLLCTGVLVLVAVIGWLIVAPAPSSHVVERLPNARSSFTQGLSIHDGKLVETTGLVGRSRITVADAATGALELSKPLPAEVFGEGSDVVQTPQGDVLHVLTLDDGRILRYAWPSLETLDELPLEGEGWGACSPGPQRLWVSDGSDTLRLLDTIDGSVVERVSITVDGKSVEGFNELECLTNGSIAANSWGSDKIAVIEPQRGEVSGVLDLGYLREEVEETTELADGDVLNGIAVDADGTWVVTGKRWPVAFRLAVPGYTR